MHHLEVSASFDVSYLYIYLKIMELQKHVPRCQNIVIFFFTKDKIYCHCLLLDNEELLIIIHLKFNFRNEDMGNDDII